MNTCSQLAVKQEEAEGKTTEKSHQQFQNVDLKYVETFIRGLDYKQ